MKNTFPLEIIEKLEDKTLIARNSSSDSCGVGNYFINPDVVEPEIIFFCQYQASCLGKSEWFDKKIDELLDDKLSEKDTCELIEFILEQQELHDNAKYSINNTRNSISGWFSADTLEMLLNLTLAKNTYFNIISIVDRNKFHISFYPEQNVWVYIDVEKSQRTIYKDIRSLIQSLADLNSLLNISILNVENPSSDKSSLFDLDKEEDFIFKILQNGGFEYVLKENSEWLKHILCFILTPGNEKILSCVAQQTIGLVKASNSKDSVRFSANHLEALRRSLIHLDIDTALELLSIQISNGCFFDIIVNDHDNLSLRLKFLLENLTTEAHYQKFSDLLLNKLEVSLLSLTLQDSSIAHSVFTVLIKSGYLSDPTSFSYLMNLFTLQFNQPQLAVMLLNAAKSVAPTHKIFEEASNVSTVTSQAHINNQLAKYIESKNNPADTHVINFLKGKNAQGQPIDSGLCFGLSIMFGTMIEGGFSDWWDKALEAIAMWEGDEQGLNSPVGKSLPKPPIILSDSLRDIFEYSRKFVLKHQCLNLLPGEEQQTQQWDYLSPNSELEIIYSNGITKKIKNSNAIAGHFTRELLIDCFDEKQSEGNIFIVSKPRHATYVGYVQGNWLFYDSNNNHYPSGNACKKFTNKHDLIDALLNRLGNDLSIFGINFLDSKPVDFPAFEEFIKIKHQAESLLKHDGFLMLMTHAKPILSRMLNLISEEKSGSQVLAESLSHRYFNAFQGLKVLITLDKNKNLIPNVLKILSETETINDYLDKMLLENNAIDFNMITNLCFDIDNHFIILNFLDIVDKIRGEKEVFRFLDEIHSRHNYFAASLRKGWQAKKEKNQFIETLSNSINQFESLKPTFWNRFVGCNQRLENHAIKKFIACLRGTKVSDFTESELNALFESRHKELIEQHFDSPWMPRIIPVFFNFKPIRDLRFYGKM